MLTRVNSIIAFKILYEILFYSYTHIYLNIIESSSFKPRILHDTGMIHSRYIRDAF